MDAVLVLRAVASLKQRQEATRAASSSMSHMRSRSGRALQMGPGQSLSAARTAPTGGRARTTRVRRVVTGETARMGSPFWPP
jgi:hypothetical protein